MVKQPNTAPASTARRICSGPSAGRRLSQWLNHSTSPAAAAAAAFICRARPLGQESTG